MNPKLALFVLLNIAFFSLSFGIETGKITNPEVGTFSPISVTVGPVYSGNHISFAKENRLYILDNNRNTIFSTSSGENILKIKKSIYNGKEVFTSTSLHKVLIYSNEGILKEISFEEELFPDHKLVNISGEKFLLSFNYPALSDLDGNILWERKDFEARFLETHDLDSDGQLEIIGTSSGFFTLNSDSNLLWSKNIVTIQPPLIANIDNSQQSELIVPTEDRLHVFDYTGSEKWNFPVKNIHSDNSLVKFIRGQIVLATSGKIIVLDNNGKLIKTVETKIHPKSLELVDIDNDGETEYLISDDISLSSFSDSQLEWKINLKDSRNFIFENINRNGFIEILAGTAEGIKIITNKETPILLQLSKSKEKAFVNEIIKFDASKSNPVNLQFRWDFNSDGIFDTDWSSQKVVERSFDIGGNHTVTLEGTDGKNIESLKAYVEVFSENLPPTIRLLISPETSQEDQEVSFFAQAQDREEDNLLYRFDIDSDGIFEQDWTENNFYSQKIKIGTYQATLEVKDLSNEPVGIASPYKVVEKPKEFEVPKGNIFPVLAVILVIVFATLIIFIVLRMRHLN